MSKNCLRIKRLRWRSAARPIEEFDQVVGEEPLEIRIRGRSIAVTMRTPGHDEELAAGFLLSEGLLRHRKEVIAISPCTTGNNPENTLNVFLSPRVRVDYHQLTRHVFASSSCGLCGKASIDEVHRHFPAVTSSLKVSRGVLLGLPAKMRRAQKTFARTGGVHAAALFNSTGSLLVLREDVGRHNAVDKVLGWAFLHQRLPLERAVLFVSGRASFEILQKALAGRIPVVAAISAPSSLAVQFARESEQTLVGFLRNESMNVYAGAERLGLANRKNSR